MNSDEVVQYLANTIAVARADGVLNPAEESVLASIAADIRAGKKDLREAQKLAASPEFAVRPVGRYSEQIRNTEDMILMAMAEHDAADTERAVVVSFAREVGITQWQLDRISAESAARAVQLTSLSCPNCRAECQANAKFCPECGNPLQAAPQTAGTRLQFDYPLTGVAVEFSETTVATFDAALRAAKAAPDFQEAERNRKRWYLAAWPSGTVADALGLVDLLRGMRNRRVYVNGEEHPWDDVFRFLPCLAQRNSAYKPTEYCFGADERTPNLWGCKQLEMDWVEWGEWFSYGKYESRDVFAFDKARIGHELNARLHPLRFCPHLRTDLIQAVATCLPDRVHVGQRTGWKHKESYHETPESIKVVERETSDGIIITNEFFSDGVAPVGFEVAKSILGKALSGCGIRDVDMRVILP
jgi:hypothetical protein